MKEREMRAFTKFVEEFDRASSADELSGVFQGAIEAFGFKTFSYFRMRAGRLDRITPEHFGTQLVIRTTLAPEWRDHYREMGYFMRDPTIAACRNRMMPLRWDDLESLDDVPGDMEVMRDARDHGILTGFSVPVHTPYGGQMMLSLASGEKAGHIGDLLDTFQYDIHLLAIHYHEYMGRFAKPSDDSEQIKLSPRELECLQWTAEGKTAWEISEILGISENTVNFHLKNSMSKLDVHSKTHAVAKSISLGLASI